MPKKDSDSVAHFFGGQTTDDDFDFTLGTTPVTGEVTEDQLEGEIAVDVFQTETAVVIVSPIAGVAPEDIEISATDDSITVSGERKAEHLAREGDIFTQEIYWGAFSRTVQLPVPCLVDKAEAEFRHGILAVSVPKAAREKKRTIKVNSTQ